ncbi:MAG: hypothetical protein SOY06_08480 [Prevotella sp.]|nr:hypothetical protein [Bacteroidales bacterium]MDY4229864.1 hypothetical protein [Prevotella sp.]
MQQQISDFVISRVWQKKQIFMNEYMYLAVLENQVFWTPFADYISNLSKLRQDTADIQWIVMNYQNRTLFL